MADEMDIDTYTTSTTAPSADYCANNDGTDDFNALSDAFMAWLKARPGITVNPNIAIADLRSEGAGRGVVTTVPLTPTDTLFSIPHSSVLSVSTSFLTTTHIPDTMAKLNSSHPWMALVLALIYETRPDSEWKPYIDILPREFDTLMFWSKDELSELEGCAVVGKVGKEEAEETFREVLAPLIREHSYLFKNTDLKFDINGDLIESSLITVAHRMASCIMSYSFDIELPKPEGVAPSKSSEEADNDSDEDGDSDEEEKKYYKGLVPLADLLNADFPLNNARLFHHPDSLSMVPLRDIPANTLLYNDYGPLPRSDLLRRYGYLTLGHAKFDVVEFGGDLVIDQILASTGTKLSEKTKKARIEFLLEEGVLEDAFELGMPNASPAAQLEGQEEMEGKEIPDEWRAVFHVLMLPKDAEPALPSSPSAMKTIAKAPAYKAAVLSILRARLSKYSPAPAPASNTESIPDLVPVDAKAPISSLSRSERRKQMGREVRMGEIKILEAWMGIVEGWEVDEEEEKKNQEGKWGKKRKAAGSEGKEAKGGKGKRARR